MTCPVCAKRDAADGRTICDGCCNRIDFDLFRIAELVRLAADWTEARKATQEATSRPVAGSRPPLDISALDATLGLAGGIVDTATRDKEQAAKISASGLPAWLRPTSDTTRDTVVQDAGVVTGCLESWVKLTREEAGLSPWGVATEGRAVTVPALVAFLRSWLAWITERPDYPVEDLAREVRDLRWQLEHLDPDRDKPGLRIPCPADSAEADGRSCGYRLVLGPNLADDLHCPRCDSDWTGNRLILVALNDPGVTVWAYPDVITDTLGIPARTLRDWAHAGHVTRMGSRYDVGAAFRRRISA